jgi:hypothetical protein
MRGPSHLDLNQGTVSIHYIALKGLPVQQLAPIGEIPTVILDLQERERKNDYFSLPLFHSSAPLPIPTLPPEPL